MKKRKLVCQLLLMCSMAFGQLNTWKRVDTTTDPFDTVVGNAISLRGDDRQFFYDKHVHLISPQGGDSASITVSSVPLEVGWFPEYEDHSENRAECWLSRDSYPTILAQQIFIVTIHDTGEAKTGGAWLGAFVGDPLTTVAYKFLPGGDQPIPYSVLGVIQLTKAGKKKLLNWILIPPVAVGDAESLSISVSADGIATATWAAEQVSAATQPYPKGGHEGVIAAVAPAHACSGDSRYAREFDVEP